MVEGVSFLQIFTCGYVEAPEDTLLLITSKPCVVSSEVSRSTRNENNYCFSMFFAKNLVVNLLTPPKSKTNKPCSEKSGQMHCQTLPKILKQHAAPQDIDWLSLDVERAELEVLAT